MQLKLRNENEIIVTGGRDFSDYVKLHSVLEKLKPTKIIQGGCSGADDLARIWAQDNNISLHTVPADWSMGPKAGPIRNQKMLETFQNATIVAFPGGRGTQNCITTALKMKRLVLQVL